MSKQTQAKRKIVTLGKVLKRKDGKGTYLQLNADIVVTDYKGVKHEFKAKDIMSIDDPRKRIQFRLEKGYIDEATAEEQLAKTPDFVMFEVTGASE